MVSDHLQEEERIVPIGRRSAAFFMAAATFSEFGVLGESAELYGPVASVPTTWRCLAGIRRA
jgi:hypothetical protein